MKVWLNVWKLLKDSSSTLITQMESILRLPYNNNYERCKWFWFQKMLYVWFLLLEPCTKPAKDSCTGGSIGIYKIQKLLQNCSNSEKINELNQWTVFNEIIVSKNSYIFESFRHVIPSIWPVLSWIHLSPASGRPVEISV